MPVLARLVGLRAVLRAAADDLPPLPSDRLSSLGRSQVALQHRANRRVVSAQLPPSGAARINPADVLYVSRGWRRLLTSAVESVKSAARSRWRGSSTTESAGSKPLAYLLVEAPSGAGGTLD